MRIGIAGVSGRVGRLLVDEIVLAGATLVGGTARTGCVDGVRIFETLEQLASQIDGLIDFTHADAASSHARIVAEAGVCWVLGTTGLSSASQRDVEQAAARIAIVQAANFSPGVALLLELAARMAASLPAERYDAEILEMHHRQKRDAPSGTALAIGQAVAGARSVALDAARARARDGETGARKPGAIGFASLRGGQIVGEHSLLFTAAAEQITLTHRAFDRRVFASGAVRAALWTETRQPGLYGMTDVLGLRQAP